MREIGKNICAVRKSRQLTQEQLAQRLHTTRQTVSNYETGRSRPDVDMLIQIAQALETDVRDLLYGPPPPPDHHRKLRALAVGGTLSLLLLFGSWLLGTLTDPAVTNIVGFRVVQQACLLPALSLVLAWTLLQGGSLLLPCAPLRQPWTRWPRRLLLSLTAAYFLLIFPYALHLLRSALAVYHLHLQRRDFSYSSAFSLFPLWDRTAAALMFWGRQQHLLFLLLGGVLWFLGFPTPREPPPPPPESKSNS